MNSKCTPIVQFEISFQISIILGQIFGLNKVVGYDWVKIRVNARTFWRVISPVTWFTFWTHIEQKERYLHLQSSSKGRLVLFKVANNPILYAWFR